MKPSSNMKVHTCEKRVTNIIIREKAVRSILKGKGKGIAMVFTNVFWQKCYLEKRMADSGIALYSNCNCEVD